MAGADTRNIALVGHGGAGKTTLAEAILFHAKAVSRQGKVSEKNTVSDHADDEKERGHSIDIAVLHADWKGKKFHIVDTPGYPDFVGQALRGIDAADCVVIVVHAYDGVQLNTRRLFHAAGEAGLPRVVVVNRCDAENIDQTKLEELGNLLGTAGRPVTLPDAWGPAMAGVKSIFAGAPGKEEFVEAAVEADDALMEKYLEAGEVSDDDLARAIPLALRVGTLVPVFHTCAEKGLGVAELLDFLAQFGPSPLDRVVKDTDGNEISCREGEPLRALCFKVTFERQAGRVVFLRLFSGSLRSGDTAVLARTEGTIKIGHAAVFQGDKKTEVDHAGPGDIVGLPKVDDVAIGDTLHAPGQPVHLAVTTLPNPMVGLAISPKTRGDESKLARELERITATDPCLVAERQSSTNEQVLKGLSTLHLDIALKRMAHAGVEVETSVPRIPYLETIVGKANGHYRHKKQTGGAGQFGEVYLKVEPLPRGAADPLDYVDETHGGSIPRQFLPAIEKGIRQKMAEGVVAGYPVVDVRAIVYDGKYHDVDSKEIAFIIAGRNAFAEAIQAARPMLLEPVCNLEIEIPSRCMGDITSDLNSRRARIQGMDSHGDLQVIKAIVPLAEIQTYGTQLRSITQGEGTYSVSFSHYDVVPGNVAQQVIAKAQAGKSKEEE